MSPLTRMFALATVAGVLAFTGTLPSLPAQDGQQGNLDNQQGPPPVAIAQFRSVPQPVAYLPTSLYGNYNGPVGGALSGASDVINAQGQFMVQNQQALQMREGVLQSRQDTRRKTLDEYLYERANTPTKEDDAERYRTEILRASRDNPSPTEIWSGKAPNRLLQAIQRQIAQGMQGPNIPLDADTVAHINVTTGAGGGNYAMLKNGGKLTWPDALLDSSFDDNRKKMDQLAAQAAEQVQSGSVDGGTVRNMKKALDSLQTELRQNVSNIDINEYSQAKDCLRNLDGAIKALQNPNVGSIASRKWSGQANSVGGLADQMTRQGLTFAPALAEDHPAYNALYQGLVAYLVWPQKPWDPTAK
jgi:hypothetical protein